MNVSEKGGRCRFIPDWEIGEITRGGTIVSKRAHTSALRVGPVPEARKMKAPRRKPGVGVPNQSSPGGTAFLPLAVFHELKFRIDRVGDKENFTLAPYPGHTIQLFSITCSLPRRSNASLIF